MITREILRRSYRAWLSHDRANAGPWWLAYLWTLVFCFVVAAGFTIVGYALSAGSAGSAGRPTHAMDLWRWYQANLVISLCVGYAIHFLFSAGRRIVGNKRLLRLKQWQRTAYYTLIPIIGVSIGWPLGLLWALGVDLRQWLVSIGMEPHLPVVDQEQPERPRVPGLLHERQALLIQGAYHLLVTLGRSDHQQGTQRQ